MPPLLYKQQLTFDLAQPGYLHAGTKYIVRNAETIFCPPSHQEFLHSKNFLHGNIRARGVLVTKEFTAKLWGLHGVYTRNNKGTSQREDPSMKKWQAPELLAKRIPGQSSDM